MKKLKLTGTPKLGIAFKSRILNVHSSCPTFFEGLIYILQKAKQNNEGTEAFKFYQNLPAPLVSVENPMRAVEQVEDLARSRYGLILRPKILDNCKTLSPDPYTHHQSEVKWLTYNSGAELLHSSKSCLTSLYKVKAGYLKDVILDDTNDHEYVVVKIYNPTRYDVRNDNEFAQHWVWEHYCQEMHAIERLLNSEEYNNVYLRHMDIEVQYHRGYGEVIKGYAIISRFIQSE
ncbi:hypothetical protein PSN45_004721 [Yamadazyma tenuis]|uniref:uncharacterized protein n=1 Tax=Candida tenuis TaxID=2315449 RepID=UPI0027AAEE1C|nr:hypothetical protein PSN45_004721 [Yamadazyma tenuis]